MKLFFLMHLLICHTVRAETMKGSAVSLRVCGVEQSQRKSRCKKDRIER